MELNFIKLNRPPNPSLKRLFMIFGTAFIVVMAILNSPHIFSQAKFQVSYDEDQENERLTEKYRSIYGYEATHTPVATTIAPTPSATAIISDNTIVISKIGVEAPILETASQNQNEWLKLLNNGVLVFPGSSLPGNGGTTAILGHSSSDLPWTKYSNIFSLLGRLEKEDLIDINFNGRIYTYRVTGKQTGTLVELRKSASLLDLGDLVLSTCWPIGSDRGRILVTADLVMVR